MLARAAGVVLKPSVHTVHVGGRSPGRTKILREPSACWRASSRGTKTLDVEAHVVVVAWEALETTTRQAYVRIRTELVMILTSTTTALF
jgi:hypothetical protein